MATITTTTVRDATFDVLRERGLTTLFANPGSTEIPLLSGLPEDLRFVLALHEASVVGLATGLALATNEPALAILHTTAGLGNAVAALATARVNRAPLVVIVGQQDRRHLATSRSSPGGSTASPATTRCGSTSRSRPGRAGRHLPRLPRRRARTAGPRW